MATLEQVLVVLDEHFEPVLDESGNPEALDHPADRSRLRLPGPDRKVESFLAADAPYPVRRARQLLDGIAIGKVDVTVLGVFVGRGPDEFADVSLDVGERETARVLDVADLPLAFSLADGVRLDDLGPEPEVDERVPQRPRVRRGLDDDY